MSKAPRLLVQLILYISRSLSRPLIDGESEPPIITATLPNGEWRKEHYLGWSNNFQPAPRNIYLTDTKISTATPASVALRVGVVVSAASHEDNTPPFPIARFGSVETGTQHLPRKTFEVPLAETCGNTWKNVLWREGRPAVPSEPHFALHLR